VVAVSSLLILGLLGFFGYRRHKHARIDSIRRKNSKSRLSRSQKILSQVSASSSAKVGISARFDEYRATMDYDPQMPDELELHEGDIVFKLFEYDDGWAKGYNTRTQEEGVYPVSFAEKSVPNMVSHPTSPVTASARAMNRNH
jgi:hypothetical protein